MTNDLPPPMSLEELITYFQGVYETTVMVKGRAAKIGRDALPVVRDIGRFQKMVSGYLDALRKTAEMHRRSD